MALSLGSLCIKYMLCISNFIFVLSGIILVSVGATIQALYYTYDDFLDQGYFSVPSLIISVGAIIFIVSFFGCCGAFKENYCMTVTFFLLLILIFVLELVAGISGYVLRDSVEGVLQNNLNNTLKNYDSNHNQTVELWDQTQQNLQCCGVYNSTDWVQNGKVVPVSCCLNTTLVNNTCPTDKVFERGCALALEDIIKGQAAVLGGVCITIAVVQLLGIIFACNLASSIRKDYETV